MSGSTAAAVVVACVAGLAGSVQAAVMGELGERVGIVAAIAFSALVSFVIGIAVLLSAGRGFAGIRDVIREPPWLWIGGALSVFIILAVTLGPPRIGTAATIGLIIVGNLVMAAVIDQFGLFGLDRIPLDATRVLGIVLLGIGAALTLHGA